MKITQPYTQKGILPQFLLAIAIELQISQEIFERLFDQYSAF